MRRLADELGTGAASLYWHVGSKDGLLDLVFDRVIGESRGARPRPERWQEQLKEVARRRRAPILRHRDIVRISIGRIPMGPNALRFSERVLAILRAGGVPDQLAVTGQHLLFAIVNGFTLDETTDLGVEIEAPVDEQAANAARDYVAALPPTSSPTSSPSPATLVRRQRSALRAPDRPLRGRTRATCSGTDLGSPKRNAGDDPHEHARRCKCRGSTVIDLREPTEERHELLERFWQLFLHDLSEFRDSHPDERGAFKRRHLEPYLVHAPDRIAYVVYGPTGP